MRLHGFLAGCLIVASLFPSLLASAEPAKIRPIPDNPAEAIKLPAGFKAQVFYRMQAGGGEFLRGPRFMAFDLDGNLYVSMGMDNKVLMLPDKNQDGMADEAVVVADNLNAPQGLAFVEGQLLVANQDSIVRMERKKGQWPATATETLVHGLPGGGHMLKTLKLGPDGFLYLGVGSSCNVCREREPLRATILRYTSTGKPAGAMTDLGAHINSPIWASGLRNSEGLAWHPKTGAMFATDNGADMRSEKKGGKPNDNIPPDELNRIVAGKHYGWPHCWGYRLPDPNFPGDDGFCAATRGPALTLPAHAAALGMTFLDKAAFPEDYKDDAIVALHGSWNRSQPAGYKLVRIKFGSGKKADTPVDIVDFATGWLDLDGAWGRPVDVVVGPDGALYVSDDRAAIIYRISYSSRSAKKG
jgi:glucose/arabinose dehydrogenase